MIVAGVIQALIGIEAARRDLEDIAPPLSEEAAEDDEPQEHERAPQPRPRRRRLGPSEAGLSYSPVQQSSTRVPDEDIEEEIDALAAALREVGHDGLDRKTLGERVNCRLWGPGRYRRALATAMARGAIRQTGRDRYVAEEDALTGGR